LQNCFYLSIAYAFVWHSCAFTLHKILILTIKFQKSMSKTIKYWLVANIEGLSGVFFFYILYTLSSNDNPELSNAFKLETIHWVIFGLISAVNIYLSVLVAIFAYRNFDEVVSLRMLFQNSNVSLFQEQLKYSISRFFSMLGLLTMAFFTIYFIVLFIIH